MDHIVGKLDQIVADAQFLTMQTYFEATWLSDYDNRTNLNMH